MNKQIFKVEGMTCNNCKASVTEKISHIPGVEEVVVDLGNKTAELESNHSISVQEIERVLPEKYQVSTLPTTTSTAPSVPLAEPQAEKSELAQLKPLFLIFLYITVAAIWMNSNPWNGEAFMLDFMGLFYIVFSFFKILDLKGFPDSFRMYDPLAKLVPAYAWIYPFIETALGIFFLTRFQIPFALVATIVILGITTFGVTRSLLDKRQIQCACLGTALKLPMTKATFIENSIMLVMAVWMLIKM